MGLVLGRFPFLTERCSLSAPGEARCRMGKFGGAVTKQRVLGGKMNDYYFTTPTVINALACEATSYKQMACVENRSDEGTWLIRVFV